MGSTEEPRAPRWLSIAGAAADEQIVAAYDDADALRDLASRCDAITCEFENVPAASLALLEQYKPVRPAASAVRVCQDRREEKAFLTRAGVPVAPNLTLLPGEPLPALPGDLFPAILKTAREGYDGKGQWTIHQADELPAALAAGLRTPAVLQALRAAAQRARPDHGGLRMAGGRSPSTAATAVGSNAALQAEYGCSITIPAGAATAVAGWDADALMLLPLGQSAPAFSYDSLIAAGAEVEMVPDPRKEAAENELIVHNDNFLALGLDPITLSEGLLMEINETAGRYADRADLSRIPATSLWTRHQQAGVPASRASAE